VATLLVRAMDEILGTQRPCGLALAQAGGRRTGSPGIVGERLGVSVLACGLDDRDEEEWVDQRSPVRPLARLAVRVCSAERRPDRASICSR
jgi:hypothetical protein